jgi:hypothetical protein
MNFTIDDEGYVIFGDDQYTIHYKELETQDWFFSHLMDKTWMHELTLIRVFLRVLPLAKNPEILTKNFTKAFTKTDFRHG